MSTFADTMSLADTILDQIKIDCKYCTIRSLKLSFMSFRPLRICWARRGTRQYHIHRWCQNRCIRVHLQLHMKSQTTIANLSKNPIEKKVVSIQKQTFWRTLLPLPDECLGNESSDQTQWRASQPTSTPNSRALVPTEL